MLPVFYCLPPALDVSVSGTMSCTTCTCMCLWKMNGYGALVRTITVKGILNRIAMNGRVKRAILGKDKTQMPCLQGRRGLPCGMVFTGRNIDMSDRFACGIAEQMIPRYAKGGCTDAEKRFLEKHCAECIECSVRLIHEKNKQEAQESSQFDRDYQAESRDHADTAVHVYDAGQEEMLPESTAGPRDRLFEETESLMRRPYRRGLDARAIIAVTVLIIGMAVGIIAAVFVTITNDMALHFRLEDMLDGLEEDDFDDYDYDELSDYSGPIVLTEDHAIDWKDPVLEERVREATGIEEGDIMYSDVLSITWIDLSGEIEEEDEKITDISALAEFKNLESLYLSDNGIEDISPLRELTELNSLHLSGNRIQDMDALKDMKNLNFLSLYGNQISDIGPLEDLEDLLVLDLGENRISDISPLRKLVNLEVLYLPDNRISDITPLRDMEALNMLDLSGNEIREVDVLKELPSLEELDIWDNPIEDESILSELDAEVNY